MRNLNPFQKTLYAHLEAKKDALGLTSGTHRGQPNKSFLAETFQDRPDQSPLIYEGVRAHLATHWRKNPFRVHQFFHHVASSQAANINLFVPILTSPRAADVLNKVRPDFAELATDTLDRGFCLEYWGGNFPETAGGVRGLLRDKSHSAGTDADLAIAYRNRDNDLCLWMIEHILTEAEFTQCGGARSPARKDKHREGCDRSFDQIADDPGVCYYHDVRHFAYWEITKAHRNEFSGRAAAGGCPFRGGMNQLWRNYLLAVAIERDEREPFKHAHFSVVKHPQNKALDKTIRDFRALVGESPRFSVFDSGRFVEAAECVGDTALQKWAAWYRDIYAA
jgi:hypothetical protein